MANIVIDITGEQRLKKELENRKDFEALRIKRYLSMADLSRTPGSPLKEIIDLVKKTTTFQNFDDIKIPEIISTHILFDLFGFAPNHPARSKSDTYYVDEKNVLRTHDTVMWYYYLNHPEIQGRVKNGETLGVICYGKVYRKDEIDKHHMNIFHQFGGLYLVPDSKQILKLDDLKNALADVAKSIFGQDAKYRFNKDEFPYTEPSLEMEIEINGQWIEMLGGGMPKAQVLKNFGVTGYNGWAFGFGLERLSIVSMSLPDIRLLWSQNPRVTKQMQIGKKFVEVSKYPPITRDISFVVDTNFVPNNYFDLIRDIGGDLVEQVELLDKFENEKKFGQDKISYTYRVVYRSNDRTLKTDEVDPLQNKLYQETKQQFHAELR